MSPPAILGFEGAESSLSQEVVSLYASRGALPAGRLMGPRPAFLFTSGKQEILHPCPPNSALSLTFFTIEEQLLPLVEKKKTTGTSDFFQFEPPFKLEALASAMC